MTIADDYVAALKPWITPDLEIYARSLAGMFAQVEQYAADPDETAVAPVVIRPNKCPNPSFEHDQIAAAPAGWHVPAFSGGGSPTVTTFAVQTGWAASGSHSLRLTGASVAAGGEMYTWHDLQPATPGQLWSARAVLNVLGANTAPELAIDFYNASSTYISSATLTGSTATGVKTLTLTDQIAPAGAAFATARAFLKNTSGGAAAVDGYVDSVQTFSGGPVPSAFSNGDTAGWQWTGPVGNSPSQPTPPIPAAGWSIMLDPDLAPAAGLPYLAQWVGERLPAGITETSARQWIKTAPNQVRGTIAAIAHSAMRWLTGTQTVYTKERSKIDLTVDPDWLAIITFASETPSPALVLAELRKTVPADINIDYQAATTATWAGLEGTYATWTALEAASSTWLAAEALTAGTVPPGFTRWTP